MITALVLAAGQSKRMGQPKMLLPWGNTTVLGHVISTFITAGVKDVMVVTGGAREQVEVLVGKSVRTVFNSEYEKEEMLSSIQVGLARLKPEVEAILVALGDQPQVREGSVRLVIESYRENRVSIVVPSFQMRRGHPWLVAKRHWDEINQMRSPESMRDFLKRHEDEIFYVDIDNNSILQDLDTPEDYLKSKP
jgi:molybdenum cofactor cytidylyltransferase